MEVAPVTGEPSAGMQYVLLIDPATDESRGQVEVQADGSSVAYQFDGAAPASTSFCPAPISTTTGSSASDPAEACGAYPVENAPVSIVVSDGAVVGGVDFLVAYRTGVPTSSSSKSASKTCGRDATRRMQLSVTPRNARPSIE